jgi:quinol-cytochrome oxidoreductase complex cytochrome b subunit
MAPEHERRWKIGEEEEEGVPFFPNHLLKEVMVVFMVVGVILALTTFAPAPVEPQADPFTTPSHIKPEWYFLAAYQFLKMAEIFSFMGAWAPKVIGVFGPGLIFVYLLALPFIDRDPNRKRKFINLLGLLILVLFAVLTVWGKYS